MKFSNILTYSYWFDINRVLLQRSDKLVVLIGVLLVLFGIAMRVVAMLESVPLRIELFKKLARLGFTIGFLEIAWFGARYEYVKLFGTRAVAAAILLIGLWWLISIIRYYFRDYKPALIVWHKEQQKQKYLNPKK